MAGSEAGYDSSVARRGHERIYGVADYVTAPGPRRPASPSGLSPPQLLEMSDVFLSLYAFHTIRSLFSLKLTRYLPTITRYLPEPEPELKPNAGCLCK